MFELIDKKITRNVQFAAIPVERVEEMWAMYASMGEEERYCMFKALTGAAVYSLSDSVITAHMMVGLLKGGVDGFDQAVGAVIDTLDPNAEHPMLPDEVFDRLLDE